MNAPVNPNSARPTTNASGPGVHRGTRALAQVRNTRPVMTLPAELPLWCSPRSPRLHPGTHVSAVQNAPKCVSYAR